MRHRAILPFVVLSLGFGLAGCGGGGLGGGLGDVVDTVVGWIPDTKKPLPGERKAVFPEGVPGVPQGVPPELVKGYQAETAPAPEPPATQVAKPATPPKQGKPKAGGPQNITPGDESERAAAETEKPKPKKKKTAAKPPEKPTAKQPTQSSQPPKNQTNQAAWPGVPSAQSARPAPWPAPPSQPTAAWPDPRQPQQPSQ